MYLDQGGAFVAKQQQSHTARYRKLATVCMCVLIHNVSLPHNPQKICHGIRRKASQSARSLSGNYLDSINIGRGWERRKSMRLSDLEGNGGKGRKSGALATTALCKQRLPADLGGLVGNKECKSPSKMQKMLDSGRQMGGSGCWLHK